MFIKCPVDITVQKLSIADKIQKVLLTSSKKSLVMTTAFNRSSFTSVIGCSSCEYTSSETLSKSSHFFRLSVTDAGCHFRT